VTGGAFWQSAGFVTLQQSGVYATRCGAEQTRYSVAGAIPAPECDNGQRAWSQTVVSV